MHIWEKIVFVGFCVFSIGAFIGAYADIRDYKFWRDNPELRERVAVQATGSEPGPFKEKNVYVSVLPKVIAGLGFLLASLGVLRRNWNLIGMAFLGLLPSGMLSLYYGLQEDWKPLLFLIPFVPLLIYSEIRRRKSRPS